MRIFVFVLFAFLFIYNVNAKQYLFEKINTRSGLSQNDVISICQDTEGFLWFGTNDGLNRYDGKNFKIYRKGEKELTSSIINRIVEDKKKNLWVSTIDNGINKINLITDEITQITSDNSNLLSNNINSLVIDNEGTIWYCTNEGMGKITEGKNGLIIENFPDPQQNESLFVRSNLYVDDDNTIWILAKNKISKLEGDQIVNKINSSEIYFRDMKKLPNGYLFICQKGAFVIDFNKAIDQDFKPEKYIEHGVFRAILRTSMDEYFLGDDIKIVKYIFDKKEGLLEKDTIFEKNRLTLEQENIDVLSIFQDKTGIIYLGTRGNGVMKYNPLVKKFNHYTINNSKAPIRSIYEDTQGNIYIGHEGGALYLLPRKKRQDFEHGLVELDLTKASKNRFVKSIFVIKEIKWGNGKSTIIGGSDAPVGIVYLSGDKLDLPLLNSRVFSITQGENGIVWIGTYNQGVFRFDPNGNKPLLNFRSTGESNSLLSDIIRSMCIDVKGRLWIGTSNGLNLLTRDEQNKENPDFMGFKYDPNDPESLSHNYILPIYESSNKEIWIGTLGAGLNRLISIENSTRARFQRFTTLDGLPNNVIKAIEEDGFGNLWISTNKGISRLDITVNEFDNFDIYEGMQDYEFGELASCHLQNGQLMFGGVNGYNVFIPEDIGKDTTKANPVFTELYVLNKPVKVGDKIGNRVIIKADINELDLIKLKYKENSFAIEFASLHYSFPLKNVCRYKLQEFDQDWIYSKSGSSARYTNLKPGTYKFILQAANCDGVWNSEEKAIIIQVDPPFYLAWPMKIAYLLILFFILVFFKQFSIVKVKRMHQLLIQEMEKEKVDEINQMKFQFFTNVSHEFKTPLTLIISPLEQLVNSLVLPAEQTLRNTHSIMYRNAKVLLKLINQLMDFRRIDKGQLKLIIQEGNLKEFLSDLHETFMPLAISKDIQFEFIPHITTGKMYFDYDKLSKVVFNLLSNAFKFTDEGGKITLEILDNRYNYVTIVVSDNGIGIKEEIQNNIFDRFFQFGEEHVGIQKSSGIGLAYTKSLVELMKGEIYFNSKEGEGTVFYVKIPTDKNIFKKEDLINPELESTYTFDKKFLVDDTQEVIIQTEDKIKNDVELATILIVEDNEDLLLFLSDYFSTTFNVLSAVDGIEGIEKARQYNPDIIITDVSMPEMNGIEMTSILKREHDTSHIPIIVLTAYSAQKSYEEGLESGADVYLTKPVKVEVLKAQVNSLLKNRELLRIKFREKIMIQPSELNPSRKNEMFLKKVIDIVEENISDPEFTVFKLSVECGMSQPTLNNKLHSLTGQKAKIFIRTIRLKRAAQLLNQGESSVSEVTYKVGFNDLQYFRKCFELEFGCLPSEYLKTSSNNNNENSIKED